MIGSATRPRHDMVDREIAEREMDAATGAVPFLLVIMHLTQI